jgi:hypothetical protein
MTSTKEFRLAYRCPLTEEHRSPPVPKLGGGKPAAAINITSNTTYRTHVARSEIGKSLEVDTNLSRYFS